MPNITLDARVHESNKRLNQNRPAISIDEGDRGRTQGNTIKFLDAQGRHLGTLKYQPTADSPFLLEWGGNLAVSGAVSKTTKTTVYPAASTASAPNSSGSVPVSSNDAKIAGAGASTNQKPGCSTCGGRRKLGV